MTRHRKQAPACPMCDRPMHYVNGDDIRRKKRVDLRYGLWACDCGQTLYAEDLNAGTETCEVCGKPCAYSPCDDCMSWVYRDRHPEDWDNALV